MKKRPRMAVFGQKLSFSASDKHLKTPPPISTVLDAKKQVQADTDHKKTIYSMRMHQHLLFFMKKNGPEWPFFGQRLSFLAPDKHSKTPPPILRVLDAKKQVVRAH